MKRHVLLCLLVTPVFVGCGGGEPDRSKGVTVIALGSRSVEVVDRPAEVDRVQQDVRKVLTAVFQGDHATTLDYTHPKLIEIAGGREKMEDALIKTLRELKAIQIESLSFPEPPTFLLTHDKDEYVVVPFESIVNSEGQRLQSRSFQLGFRRKGTSDWKYLDGSKLDKAHMEMLCPDLPPDLDLPPVSRSKL